MEAEDVERILRDVLNTRGIHVSIKRVERTPAGWHVTLADAADRVVSTDLPDDAPAVVRTALIRWAEGHL